MGDPRRIVIVGFDDVQSLDITGPLEVFDVASRLTSESYTQEIVALDAAPFRTSSGLKVVPDSDSTSCRGPIDTLIVAGGTGAGPASRDERLIAWIRSAARRSRRTASVCTGSFVLAAADLLDGRRAATHWSAADLLAERHPEIDVDPDSIFIHDDGIWTSAGVTAGIDLALALVEDDHGRATALEVARWLVVFAKRPGSQAQFSAPLAAQLADRAPIRAAQELVRRSPERELTVETLAAHAHMSVRGFARAFRREVGVTPGTYVETVRIERAVQLLEVGGAPTGLIAQDCGFGTVETFRRAFRRRMGISPGQYRDRFQSSLDQAA
jgi:transcriptional regulator GlxA family with amidase domain